MLINTKYIYQKLPRVTLDNGKRTYETPDGAKLPSVTTILSETDDKSGLDAWRKWIGEKKAKGILTDSINVGNLIHEHLECFLKNEERPKGNNFIRKLARELSDVIIEKGLTNVSEIWGIEATLYYPGLFAGTTDIIGIHNGTPAIMDFKNTRKPKSEEVLENYYCQICAYSMAHNKLYNTNIKKGVIFMVSREESHRGEYQEFIIEGKQFEKYTDKWLDRIAMFHELQKR